MFFVKKTLKKKERVVPHWQKIRHYVGNYQ